MTVFIPSALRAPEPVVPVAAPKKSGSAAVTLGLLLSLALTLRVMLMLAGPWQDVARTHDEDSQRYLDLGQSIAQFGTFGLAGEGPGVVHGPLALLRADHGQYPDADANGLRPEVYRTPLYPALIAAMIVTGVGERGLLIAQVVLSLLTVALAFDIARVATGNTAAAVLTALILAVHPASVTLAVAAAPYTLLLALLTAAVWLVMRGARQWVGLVALGGLLLGLAALAHPVALLALPVVVVYALAAALPGRKFAAGALVLVPAVLPMGLWMGRNQAQGLGPRLSSAAPIHAWCYGVAYLDIAEQRGDRERDWTPTAAARLGDLREQVQAGDGVLSLMMGLSLQEVTQRPATFLRLLGRGVVRFTLAESSGELYRAVGVEHPRDGVAEALLSGRLGTVWSAAAHPTAASVELAWVLWNAALAVAMAVGCWRMLLQNHGAAAVLCGGLWVVFLLAGAMFDAEAMRMPALAAQAVLAGAAFLTPALPVRVGMSPRAQAALRE